MNRFKLLVFKRKKEILYSNEIFFERHGKSYVALKSQNWNAKPFCWQGIICGK